MNSKRRFFLLIIGAVVLFLISYLTAISKTLTLRKQYRSLEKEAFLNKDVSLQFQVISKKQVYYDSILQTMNLTDTSLENNFLKTLNAESKKGQLKLKTFNTPHLFLSDDAKYVSYDFTLEGDFVNMMKLLHKIEIGGTFGVITHLDFKKETDFRTRKKSLTSRVLIQSVQ